MPSARDIQGARKRIEFQQEFEEKQRTNEDAAQYEEYCKNMRAEGLKPLNFCRWREFIPEELKDNAPEIRGLAASNRATYAEINQVKKERIAKHKLMDKELFELGFEIRWRPDYQFEQISQAMVTDIFTRFREKEPRFLPKEHLVPVGEFITRNRLGLTPSQIQVAFDLLLSFGIIQLPAPVIAEPEVQTNPELNPYGVNLGIDHDAELQRQAYENEVVVTDPETGREYTAYQLDNVVDSETYRRLMRIPRVSKNPALEPKH